MELGLPLETSDVYLSPDTPPHPPTPPILTPMLGRTAKVEISRDREEAGVHPQATGPDERELPRQSQLLGEGRPATEFSGAIHRAP